MLCYADIIKYSLLEQNKHIIKWNLNENFTMARAYEMWLSMNVLQVNISAYFETALYAIQDINILEFIKLPYILESNPHPFYSFRGLKKSDAD
jgi:hypothetical protein